jgi:hypothetical protein
MSFDHLVGAHYNKWRHSEAESRGGLYVGSDVEFNRQIGRPFATQNAVYIGGAARR